MAQPTIIVVGLGGMGSAASAALARRGCRVIGIERYWPTHDLGSSHGESRAIRLAYFRDPEHLPLLQEAYELWERLERDTGSQLLTRCGGLLVTPEGSQTLQASVTVADQLAVPYEMLSRSEVSRRWPTLTVPSSNLTFLDPSQGIIRPEATVSANLRLAADHGAELHFNAPVNDWRTTANGVVVHTPTERVTADHLVITPGAWATELLAAPAIPIETGRLVQIWVRPAADLATFAADRHPRLALEDDSGLLASAFSLLPGQSLIKMAFTKGPTASTPASPSNFERHATQQEAERLIDFMSQLVPSLRGQFAERSKGCIYARTPDDNFIIGRHPQQDNVTVGAAFSSHGFKFVPVIGEILADLTLNGSSSRNIDLFSPSRFPAAAWAPPQ